ncbi:MAG: FAD-dependent oxidoreductase [Pseudomonadota bacterium]
MARILIVGAGLVGAALAERLAHAGQEVIVLAEGAGPATEASFGWINASTTRDPAYFALRAAGLAAWARRAPDLGAAAPRWCGALSLDAPGDAAPLLALGYEVARLEEAEVAVREPALFLRGPALCFAAEGYLEAGPAARALLARAVARGARVLLGQRVLSVLAGDGAAVGVETQAGLLLADHTVLAAGTGTPDLLAPLGLRLPLRHRPGNLLVTAPAPAMLGHVLVTPEREIRQDASGRFLVPSSPPPAPEGHITGLARAFDMDEIAEASLAVLRRHLPVKDLRYERILRAARPVPEDGLPVIGATGIAGLSLSVMHSGATLAAVAAELLADELTTGTRHDLLAPYRLARFQA